MLTSTVMIMLMTVMMTPQICFSHQSLVFGTDAAFIVTQRRQTKGSTPSSKFCARRYRRRSSAQKNGVTLLFGTDDDDDTVPIQTRKSESAMSTEDSVSSLTTMTSTATSTTVISKSIETNQSKKKKKKSNGVYVRPSAAIERGSGFFVPGLEGYKVRLFVGTIVVLVTVILHYYNSEIYHPIPVSTSDTKPFIDSDDVYSSGNNFAEALAIFYGLLVLLQGSIEARKDVLAASSIFNSGNEQSSLNSSNGKSLQTYQQQWSVDVSDMDWRNKVEWVASTYLSLTTATNMILVGPGKIIFSLGTMARSSNIDDGVEESIGCNAALATLAQSKSGRLSLPMNHVTVRTLLFPSSSLESNSIDNQTAAPVPRSVVLQRINAQLCWMMVSNQLLASFTANDLQWLGQLAQYTNPEE